MKTVKHKISVPILTNHTSVTKTSFCTKNDNLLLSKNFHFQPQILFRKQIRNDDVMNNYIHKTTNVTNIAIF
eukprot:TRINITY_DN7226_c0_g2_i1.p2 TRINITY_DN7226_c0_g2~~TRINITY_DN7226_c0_g2_i1.p2  ORF type:complete len:72 (-),score=1.73 TRINITY_DN7226_c0_g2_i1:168-383(-)